MTVSTPPPINRNQIKRFEEKYNGKGNLKSSRKPQKFAKIPVTLLEEISVTGRCKYSSIVMATWMSLLWDGWFNKHTIKTRRVPSSEVLFTRRMMENQFGYCQNTTKHAIKKLLELKLVSVSRQHYFSRDKAYGRHYKLNWMKKAETHKIHVYWGLLSHDRFLNLPIHTQAILILLHAIHSRKRNEVIIHSTSLTKFGVHRNTLKKHVNILRLGGFIDYTEERKYKFNWFDSNNKPNFHELDIKTPAPKLIKLALKRPHMPDF